MTGKRAVLTTLLALLMLAGIGNIASAAYGAPLDEHERRALAVAGTGYGAGLDEHERRAR